MRSLLKDKSRIGCITSRSGFYIEKGEKWRTSVIEKLEYYIDFGFGVLDAMVEVGVYILNSNLLTTIGTLDLRDTEYANEKAINTNSFQFIDKNIFSLIPKSPLAYWISKSLLIRFQEKSFLTSTGWRAQIGLSTKDDFRFLRNIWESKNSSKFIPMAKGGQYARFWLDIDVAVNFAEQGFELDEYLTGKYPYLKGNTDWILHPESDYFSIGLTYTRRSSKGLSVRILQEGLMFSDMGRAIVKPDVTKDELFFMLGYMNSQFIRNTLSLFTSNIFEGGTINVLPAVKFNFNDDRHKSISNSSFRITRILNKYAKGEEWSNSFESPLLTKYVNQDFNDSLEKAICVNEDDLRIIKEEFNKLNYNVSSIFDDEYKDGAEDYDWLPIIDVEDEVKKFISYCFGLYIKRFDSNYTTKESLLKFNTDKYSQNDEIEFFEISSNSFNNDFLRCLTNHGVSKDFLSSVLNHLKFTSFYDYFCSNKYNDYHLKTYSRSRRTSPIYWLIGVPSGKFNIFIYYPKFNDGSLFKIVNELVDPKIKEIAKEVEVLEMKGSAKELNGQKEFLAELEDFKEELLRIAQLPYKPNQDDGVLITAAPLHKLFRHTKWKKKTAECWEKLEKGKYDWAHLAYSIWPDRVRKKCVKDLSMAIAHGLEDICEVKPKQRKKKKTKEIKADKQKKLI